MENKNNKEQDEENYMATGMSIGGCMGVVFGLTIFKNLALGLCFGTAIGMCIGLTIKKK